MLKNGVMMIGAAIAMFAAGQALADDNEKWINQCILDNVDQGQTTEVIRKYCTCMNYKMDDDETRSISEWEKTHEQEAIACENEAGWK